MLILGCAGSVIALVPILQKKMASRALRVVASDTISILASTSFSDGAVTNGADCGVIILGSHMAVHY